MPRKEKEKAGEEKEEAKAEVEDRPRNGNSRSLHHQRLPPIRLAPKESIVSMRSDSVTVGICIRRQNGKC